ncbi:MAG: hypothetical protein V1729_03160 [Candidatus Woesearchaeota archaeon]
MSSDEKKRYVDTRRYGGSVLFDFSEWREQSVGLKKDTDEKNQEEQRNLTTYHALKTIIESKEEQPKKAAKPAARQQISLDGLTSDEKRGVFQISGLEAVLNKNAVGVKAAAGMFCNIKDAKPPRSFELEYREAWKVTQDYLKRQGASSIESDIYYADSGSINTYDNNGSPIQAYVADIVRFEIYAQVKNKAYKFILVAFREMDSFKTITQFSKLNIDTRKDTVLKVDVFKHYSKGNIVKHHPTLVQRTV